MKKFINKLIELTGVSVYYATSAWFTLDDNDKKRPERAAAQYAERFNLIRGN